MQTQWHRCRCFGIRDNGRTYAKEKRMFEPLHPFIAEKPEPSTRTRAETLHPKRSESSWPRLGMQNDLGAPKCHVKSRQKPQAKSNLCTCNTLKTPKLKLKSRQSRTSSTLNPHVAFMTERLPRGSQRLTGSRKAECQAEETRSRWMNLDLGPKRKGRSRPMVLFYS